MIQSPIYDIIPYHHLLQIITKKMNKNLFQTCQLIINQLMEDQENKVKDLLNQYLILK